MPTLITFIVLAAVIGIPLLALRIGPRTVKRVFTQAPSFDDHAADIAARVKADPTYLPYR